MKKKLKDLFEFLCLWAICIILVIIMIIAGLKIKRYNREANCKDIGLYYSIKPFFTEQGNCLVIYKQETLRIEDYQDIVKNRFMDIKGNINIKNK